MEGRIASLRMLLDNFSPMTGAAASNRFGGFYGGKDQHGRAARGGVGGDGALPVGQTGGEGADPRCAVRDDGLASQACGARAPATRDGWAGREAPPSGLLLCFPSLAALPLPLVGLSCFAIRCLVGSGG